jgi:iron complex outermembrane receptor protein
VGGTLLLDPEISGEAVETGLIGSRPVGQVRRRSVLTLDWRTKAGKGPLSFDLSLESLSSRTGNAANTLSAPGRTVVNLGARYRFKMNGADWLVRPVLLNAFDEYGWNVSSSGGFTYIAPRALTLQLVADF